MNICPLDETMKVLMIFMKESQEDFLKGLVVFDNVPACIHRDTFPCTDYYACTHCKAVMKYGLHDTDHIHKITTYQVRAHKRKT